jgi:hypothetical protein
MYTDVVYNIAINITYTRFINACTFPWVAHEI